jgi:hypothetical protein
MLLVWEELAPGRDSHTIVGVIVHPSIRLDVGRCRATLGDVAES